MDIHTEIDTEAGIRKHKVTGDVSSAELTEFLQEIYSGSSAETKLNSLWDLTEAHIDLSTQEVQALSDVVGRGWGRAGGVRSAIAVSKDLAFGLGRVFEANLTAKAQNPVLICRSLDEAFRFLNVGE